MKLQFGFLKAAENLKLTFFFIIENQNKQHRFKQFIAKITVVIFVLQINSNIYLFPLIILHFILHLRIEFPFILRCFQSSKRQF